MARVTLSGLVSDIRGSVGGSVFQNGPAGLILRNKDIKPNRNTISQSVKRNITASLQNSWMNLSSVQRAQWTAYTQYNPVAQKKNPFRFLSGQQVFLKFNFYLLLYGETLLSVPSFSQDITPQILGTTHVGGGILTFETTAANMYIFNYIILFMSAPVNASLNNPGSRLRSVVFSPVAGTTQTITTQYTALFGRLPIVGENIFLKYTLASNVNGAFLPFVHDKQVVAVP